MNLIRSAVSEATGALGRASQGIRIAVDQDNILQAARIIESEAAHLKRRIDAYKDRLIVDPMGGDPVSWQVATVLTEKFVHADDSYVNRCHDYVAMLEALARQLYESARTYGFTEAQIQADFDAVIVEGDVVPSRPASHHGGLRAI